MRDISPTQATKSTFRFGMETAPRPSPRPLRSPTTRDSRLLLARLRSVHSEDHTERMSNTMGRSHAAYGSTTIQRRKNLPTEEQFIIRHEWQWILTKEMDSNIQRVRRKNIIYRFSPNASLRSLSDKSLLDQCSGHPRT